MLDDLDSMLDEAITAHEAKDFNSAAAKYTKILERDAHHADANHNFGLLTVELGLKDEALIFLQTAINTNPKVLQYWVTFIDTLTKVERFDDARSVLEQAYLFGYTEEVFDQLRHNLDLKQRLSEPQIKLDHANTTETVFDQVEQKQRILVDMSLTVLHHGHIRLLRKASELGTVIVALTKDDEILRHKGFKSLLNYEERKEIALSIRYVDEVVESNWLIDEAFLDKYAVDFLVHGDDNTNPIPSSRLITFPRTQGIASETFRE